MDTVQTLVYLTWFAVVVAFYARIIVDPESTP
jgi:hypothetical protein